MTSDRDPVLTDECCAEAEALAHRHGVGPDAVLVLLRALERGGGDQAQFSHPDLGGMGQWSRRGMIMVGEMFNDGLKVRVDALCRETAALLERPGMVNTAQRSRAWWPDGCGRPSATGAQNDMRYAYFPDTRRLAIGLGGRVELYDTGEHRIHGVSQRQGGGEDMRFTSQIGTIALHDLARVGIDDLDRRPRDAASTEPSLEPQGEASFSQLPRTGDGDILDVLERLHALQRKGVLSEAEFAEKKKDLLARL